jgi:predicted dehydrogenase
VSEPLRIGLIGCGRIAEHGHAPVIAASPGAVLAGVTDPVGERATALARSTEGARVFASAPELVGSGTIDAAIVASPAAVHVEHATVVARAGLPCLVEKPPAPDAEGARALGALDPAPWVAFNRRFRQGRLAAEVPAEGPLELELELCYRRRSWDPHGGGDDALLDLGPHLADLALWLGGAPARVTQAAATRERAELRIETARGVAQVRCATDRPHLERAVVGRPGGETVAAMTDGGLWRGLLARAARGPHPLAASLSGQLEAFCAAARGGDPGPLASAADGVRAMELIDRAAELAGERQQVAA